MKEEKSPQSSTKAVLQKMRGRQWEGKNLLDILEEKQLIDEEKRKLIEKEGLDLNSPCPWDNAPTTGDSLLTPTKIYVKACVPLIKKGLIKGLAHITGGGLLENLPRSLPDGVGAEISGHPPLPSVFKWMQSASGLDDNELLRTFNCGVGMVLILDQSNVKAAKESLRETSDDIVYDLGYLVEGSGVRVTSKLS